MSDIKKFFGILILGISIPLLAAVLPSIAERYINSSSITYDYVGPISVGKNYAISEILITNEGTSVEKNLEVRIPVSITRGFKEPTPEVQFHSSNPTAKYNLDDPNFLLVQIDSIKPTETLSVSFILNGSYTNILEHELQNMRITTDNTLAAYLGPGSDLYLLYKTCTWVLIIFMVGGSLWTIYFEKLMSREKKERILLKEIDKLK